MTITITTNYNYNNYNLLIWYKKCLIWFWFWFDSITETVPTDSDTDPMKWPKTKTLIIPFNSHPRSGLGLGRPTFTGDCPKPWVPGSLITQVIFIPPTFVVVEKALVQRNFYTRCVSNLVTSKVAAPFGVLATIFPEEYRVWMWGLAGVTHSVTDCLWKRCFSFS